MSSHFSRLESQSQSQPQQQTIHHTTKAEFLNPPASNPHAKLASKYTPVDEYSLSSSPVSNHDVDAADLKGPTMSHSLSNSFEGIDNANGLPASDSFMANASAPMEDDPEATAEYEEAPAAAAADEEPAIIESPPNPKYTPIDDSPVEASASEHNSISPPAVISSTTSSPSPSPSPPAQQQQQKESRATRFANYIRRKKEEHDRESREKKEKKEREKQEKKQRELAEKAAQQQQRDELDEQKQDSSSAPSSAPSSSSSSSLMNLLRSVGGSNSEKKPSGSAAASNSKPKKEIKTSEKGGSKRDTPQSPLSSESADDIESDEGSSSSGGGGGGKRSLYTQQLIHLSQSVLNFFNRSSASSNPAALFGSQPHSFTNSPAWILGRVYKLLAGPTQHANSATSSSSSSSSAAPNGGVMSIAQAQASALQLRRARFHSEWRTLLWSTYRKDFPAIGNSAYRSDAGWGCMIRSAQMMLGQVFMRHWLGRDWRRPLVRRAGKKHRINVKHHENDLTQSESEHEEDNHSQHQHEYASLPPVYLKLLGLFFDSPSASSPYSIHNLLLRGQTSKDKKIGEWFGPHQACCMMMNMMESELEKKRQKLDNETGHTQLDEEDEAVQGFGSDDVPRMSSSATGQNGELESANSVESMHYTPSPSPNDSPLAASTTAPSPSHSAIPPLFTVPKVYLSDDGTLYRDRILEIATGSADGGASSAEVEQSNDADQAFRGRSSSYTAPTAQVNLDSHEFPAPSPPTFTATFHPLLILIPLRLGVDRINPSYLPSLLSVFQFPQCVGVIGGRPRASLYFVGVQDARLFYLDPHTVQRSYDLSGEHSLRQGSLGAQHEIESTYHCDAVRSIAADSIDPSLAIGFYIENRRTLEEFWEQAKQLNEAANLLHAHHAALNHANATPSSNAASANHAAAQAAAALLPVFHVADVSPNYEGLDSDPEDDADDEDLEDDEDEGGSDLDASAVVDAADTASAEAEEGVDDEQSEFDVARAVSEKDLTSSPVLCAKQAELASSAQSAVLDGDDALEGGSLLGESAVSNEGVPNAAGMSASAVASSIHASAASLSDFTYSLSSAAASHLTSGATKLTSLTQSLASQAQGSLAQLAVHAQSMTQASVAAAARKFSGDSPHARPFEQMTGSDGTELNEEEMVNMSREGDIPISPLTATLPNSSSDLDSVVVSETAVTEVAAPSADTSSAVTPVRPHLNTSAAATSSSTPAATPVGSASASTPSSASNSTPLNRAGSGRRTKAARKSSRASQKNAQQEDEFVML